jgi:hypothetical protein
MQDLSQKVESLATKSAVGRVQGFITIEEVEEEEPPEVVTVN